MKKVMSRKKTKTSFKYLPLEIWTLILARMPAFEDLGRLGLNGLEAWLRTIRRADTLRKTGHNLMSPGNDDPLGSCIGPSVNGLILTCELIDFKQELILWNPSIRKSLVIPPCPIPSHLQVETAFVFGFAPSTKEHKIIAITSDETPGTQPRDMFFAVYTLSDQRWTVRNNGLNVERSFFEGIFQSFLYSSDTTFLYGGTVFLHGKVHCLAFDYGNNKLHLVSLDFDLESVTFLEVPDLSDKSRPLRFPFILGESVAIFSISTVKASIWVLELDDGKRVWTPWCSEPSSLDGFGLFMDHILSNGPYYYESDCGGCLIIGKKSYHIASGKVQARGKSMRRNVILETYSESLVLHKGYGAQEVDVFPVN
ncbi:uncharacterized protein LOC141638965 isoform X2 [Silene latifolia]|uniref:uncharacterized protein LOC141638965 isoform X2 n=1 Tax=Silene latifolia TaxID=37657 RepID=UPI003D7793C3